MLRVLSLGAGVQSTTIALMIANGELPKIDYAIFADTGAEPRRVYHHLSKLAAAVPFEIKIVAGRSIRSDMLSGKVCAPVFLRLPDGTEGRASRSCTERYKTTLIYRELRASAGILPRSRGPKEVVVEQLLGISTDEAHRQKDAKFRWVRNSYPLIERGLSRGLCEDKLASYGWTAPRSACTFCPFRNDDEWLSMKKNDPESFADAVAVDASLRSGNVLSLRHEAYVHRSLIPLDQVDFQARIDARPHRWQMSMFGDECEGVCGV